MKFLRSKTFNLIIETWFKNFEWAVLVTAALITSSKIQNITNKIFFTSIALISIIFIFAYNFVFIKDKITDKIKSETKTTSSLHYLVYLILNIITFFGIYVAISLFV